MDKETIKALVKQEWDKTPHSNIKDDFELVWEIREKYNLRDKYSPFNDCFFKPITINDKIKTFCIPFVVTKSELIDKLKNFPNESKLHICQDESSDIEINVYKTRKETEIETSKRVCNFLINWALTSDYYLIKKIFTLEEENAELKKKLQ